MCCQTRKHSGCSCEDRYHSGSCGCGCGCDNDSHFKRRFMTTEEKVAHLEQYLENLQMETKAVQEHIAVLKEA